MEFNLKNLKITILNIINLILKLIFFKYPWKIFEEIK
jgi:hypothetical protein